MDVYLRKTPEQRREEQAAAAKAPKPRSWKQWFIAAGIGAGVLLLLFFLSPWLIFTFMRTAAGNSKDGRKAYWVYQALNFYLHQLGYFRGRLTHRPMRSSVSIRNSVRNSHALCNCI
ncbi:MAG: hypothetical protein QM743_07365 [Chitinophagaceae bacterium]